MKPCKQSRLMAAAQAVAAILLLLCIDPLSRAQALSVSPVNLVLLSGDRSAILTLTNKGENETTVQIRIFAWNQQDDKDQLTETAAIMAGPPMATIAPGGNQIIRLLLRQPAQGREATYRILVDQIPPAVKTGGGLQMVLRLSIPVFVQPPTAASSHLQFRLERQGEKLFLVGINDGLRHDLIRGIVLSAGDAREWKIAPGASPYILSGVTRRWPVEVQGALPLPGESLRLTAQAGMAIDQEVRVAAAP
jgi:fimbrial chaperone protein